MATTTETLKCLGADCENDAGSLQCPTCLKIGIKDSFFCSQDCFKRNWVRLAPIYLPFQTSVRSATDLFLFLSSRVATRLYTKLLRATQQRMVFLTISELPKSYLNPILSQVFTIHFPLSTSPVPCDLSIRSPPNAPYPRIFHVQTTQRPAFPRARDT